MQLQFGISTIQSIVQKAAYIITALTFNVNFIYADIIRIFLIFILIYERNLLM